MRKVPGERDFEGRFAVSKGGECTGKRGAHKIKSEQPCPGIFRTWEATQMKNIYEKEC